MERRELLRRLALAERRVVRADELITRYREQAASDASAVNRSLNRLTDFRILWVADRDRLVLLLKSGAAVNISREIE